MMALHQRLSMLNPTINRTSLIQSPELSQGCLADIASQLSSLRDCYPEFDMWYSDKVVPGISSGHRSILLEYRRDQLAGFAILKDDGAEKKLCCLRVTENFQRSIGLGIRMFERAFEELGTEKPLLSVSEERLPAFQRIFDHFGFELSAVYDGRYRWGKVEFAFNGLLDVPISFAKQNMVRELPFDRCY
jgi:hypothetical protein